MKALFVAFDNDTEEAFGPFDSLDEAVQYMAEVLIAAGDWERDFLNAGRIDPPIPASIHELNDSLQDMHIRIVELKKPDLASFKT